MRDLDKQDDQPALGAPVKQPEMPKPHRKVAENVRSTPDGRFYTTAPPPPIAEAPPSIWEIFGLPRPTTLGEGWAFRSKK